MDGLISSPSAGFAYEQQHDETLVIGAGPLGGIVLALPGAGKSATINGRAAVVQNGRVVVRKSPRK